LEKARVGEATGISKGTALEVPPPGVGLATLTRAVPGVATSEAGMAAVICVAVRYVVGRGFPFHSITEAAAKPVPLMVRVKAAEPGKANAGERGGVI
jgi:hypothetical protein